MAGDKGDGDGLFEDLDRFFAPIKDVDWESQEQGRSSAPGSTDGVPEEHVSVRPAGSSDPSDNPERSEAPAVYPTEPIDLGSDFGAGFEDDYEDLAAPSNGSSSDEPFDPGFDLEGEGTLSDDDDLLYSDSDDTSRATSSPVMGPSWQEPNTFEVGLEPEVEVRGPNPGERDMPAAFLTGFGLIVVAIGTLLIGRPLFAIAATVIVLLAQIELFTVFKVRKANPATAVGLITGVLLMMGAYLKGDTAIPAMLVLGVAGTFLWYMAVPATQRKSVIGDAALTIFNVAWIPVMAAYLMATLRLTDAAGSNIGTGLVILVILNTFVFDTAAFLSGSVWGGAFVSAPLAPGTSPRKSVEGLVGGALATVAVSIAIGANLIGPMEGKPLACVLLALVVVAAATFGDLAESLVKRDARIKDMGHLLPGHGGVLDRIDSLLWVAPAAYFVFRAVL